MVYLYLCPLVVLILLPTTAPETSTVPSEDDLQKSIGPRPNESTEYPSEVSLFEQNKKLSTMQPDVQVEETTHSHYVTRINNNIGQSSNTPTLDNAYTTTINPFTTHIPYKNNGQFGNAAGSNLSPNGHSSTIPGLSIAYSTTGKPLTDLPQFVDQDGDSFGYAGSSQDQSEQGVFTDMKLRLNVTVTECMEEKCFEIVRSRYCLCDNKCLVFRDCCYFYVDKILNGSYDTRDGLSTILDTVGKQEILQNSDLNLMECVINDGNDHGYWMISKCPSNGDYSAEDEIKCESVRGYSNVSIPVDQINAFGRYLNTYKNIHCAQCNGVDIRFLKPWSGSLYCMNNTDIFITEMTPIEEIAKRCEFYLYSHFTYQQRSCFNPLNVLPNFQDVEELSEDMSALCMLYIMPVIETRSVNTGQILYRNPHCAYVWGTTNVTCAKYVPNNGSASNNPSPVNLKVFFDINLKDGEVIQSVECVKSNAVCSQYEIFDCGTIECRFLFCMSGMVPLNGRCVQEVTQGASVSFTPKVEIMFDRPLGVSRYTNSSKYFLLQLKWDINASSKIQLITIIEKVVSEIERFHYSQKTVDFYFFPCDTECVKVTLLGEINPFLFSFSIYSALLKETLNNEPDRLLDQEQNSERNYPDYEYYGSSKFDSNEYDEYSPNPNLEIPFELIVKNFDINDFSNCSNEHSDMLIGNASFQPLNMKVQFKDLNISVELSKTLWQYSITDSKFEPNGLAVTCMFKRPAEVLNCSVLAYDLTEAIIEDGFVSLVNTGKIIPNGRFYRYGDQVFVCSMDALTASKYISIYQHVDDFSVATYVSSSLSMCSTLLLLAVHIIDPKLRNIHGLNLCAISFVLLVTHLLILFQPLLKGEIICKVMAILSHHLLLNTFSWMTVIGFEMARIFSSKGAVCHRNDHRRFVKYFILSCLITTTVSCITLAFEFIPVDISFKPNFGEGGVCWLTNGRAVFVFVLVPVCFSLLMNCITYGVILLNIYRQRQAAKFASKTGGGTYLVVFLKLSLILGFSWILAIVAAFVELPWLWVVHIILNGIQGFSLLVCTLINRRVLIKMKASLRLTSLTTSSEEKQKEPVTDQL